MKDRVPTPDYDEAVKKLMASKKLTLSEAALLQSRGMPVLPSMIEETQKETLNVLNTTGMISFTGQPLSDADSRAKLDRHVQKIFGSFKQTNLSPVNLAPEQQWKPITVETQIKAMEALSEAQGKGYSRTMLLSPGDMTPRGIVSLIGQRHFDMFARLSDQAVRVNAELFCIFHTLLTHGNSDTFSEGPPYNFDFSPMQADLSLVIPGTKTPIFSQEGQQLLSQNRLLLEQTIRTNAPAKKASAFDQLFWHKLNPKHHGVEKEDSHTKTTDAFESLARGKYCLQPYDALLQRIFVSREQVRVSGDNPRILTIGGSPGLTLLHGSKSYDIAKLRALVEKRLHSFHEWHEHNERREEELVDRMEETLAEGHVPHVVFGAAHTLTLLEKFLEKNYAVLLTQPASLTLSAPADHFLDERNFFYIFLKDIVLPTFQQWEAQS